MLKKTWISLLGLPLLLTFSLNGCATPTSEMENSGSTQDKTTKEGTPPSQKPVTDSSAKNQQEMATTAINAFTTDLYAQLNSKEGNLFLSPYSISTALAMTYMGAKENTKTQMAKALQFGEDTQAVTQGFNKLQESFNKVDSNYELRIANDLWVQKGMSLIVDFTEQLHDAYGVLSKKADFARETEVARGMINDKIAQQTGDKIKELLAPGMVTPQTRLVLTNAIYFKGKWQTPFDAKDTKDLDFTKLDNSKVKVPMMYQKGQFRYLQDDEIQLIELPYQSSEGNPGLSMVILLPQVPEDFTMVEKKLPHYLQKLKDSRQPLEIGVFLPKFKLESAFQLQEPLKNMGMKDAFDPALADFSGMIKAEKLAISAVVHKAFVEVNEEGTEATAATAVVTSRGMTPSLRVDHPFIFWIKDNRSGTILFLGRVTEPKL